MNSYPMSEIKRVVSRMFTRACREGLDCVSYCSLNLGYAPSLETHADYI